MTEENTVLDFNDALNALSNASESFKIDVWIPSLHKFISFKEIDAKQQKNLLSAAIDNSIYNSDFVKTFYEIIKDNILVEDKSIVDRFTTSDKSAIAITLRSQISDDLTVKFSDEISEKISLKEIINKFVTYNSPDSETLTIKNADITISATISIPTIKDELEHEENFSKNYKGVEGIKNNKDLQSIVSEAFISELTKFIEYIKINESHIDFNDLSFNQKVKIVEKLPSGIIQKILEKVSEWKKNIDSVLTVSVGEDTKVVAIDSLLFLS